MGQGEVSKEEKPTVVAKDIDSSHYVRKTEQYFANLFDITWASDGCGKIEYIVNGNLNFKNREINSSQIANVSELEIGSYAVTCRVTSPSGQIATAEKNVKVTTLASAEVKDKDEKTQTASAIYSEYDFAFFSDLVNAGQTQINGKIMNDINLSKVCGNEEGNWNSIGTKSYPYEGILEGAGNRVEAIYIDTTEEAKGLLGYTQNATIRDMVLGTGSISAGYEVGGLIGNSKETTIFNCINHNVSVASKNYITRSYAWSKGVYTFNYSNTGGIIGYAYNSNIQDSINYANCIGNHSGIGGIVGFYEGNRERTITNCVNYANLSNTASGSACFIGGIVGECYQLGKIQNSHNRGNINGNGYIAVGGIAGELTGSAMERMYK